MGPLGLGLCEPRLLWPSHQFRQLGDVARDAPRFIESQRVGDLGIARISGSAILVAVGMPSLPSLACI